MKQLIVLPLLFLFAAKGNTQQTANRPDSAYIFAYTPERGNARTGLAFAWSNDGYNWSAIGPEHFFIYSDYGAWGAQKKMLKPFLFYTPGNMAFGMEP